MPRPVLFAVIACLIATVVPAASASQAQNPSQGEGRPAWETAIAAREQQLVAQNGAGTDAALRTELLAMRDRDQEARGLHNGEMPKQALQMAGNLAEIDAALTTELKGIVAAKGWPTIALVGIKASNSAMLILTHSADHAWQLELLPQLEILQNEGKIDGSSLALVIDKELVSEGKLQRYGSQFKFVNGEMAMYGVEDPAGLDRRRAAALLPPMSVYKELLSQMYHLKASDKVVSATAPAQ